MANIPKSGSLKLANNRSLKLVKDTALIDELAKGTAAADVQVQMPQKPRAIQDDEALSELWDTIVPELWNAKVTSRIDWPSLELMIRHFHAARMASDDLNLGEPTVWDEAHNRPMKNPSEVVFRSESMAFMAYAREMGMTFASRARVPSAPVADPENPFLSDSKTG